MSTFTVNLTLKNLFGWDSANHILLFAFAGMADILNVHVNQINSLQHKTATVTKRNTTDTKKNRQKLRQRNWHHLTTFGQKHKHRL